MSFDTLAPYYRRMEFALAGGLLQRCRTPFLAAAADSRRAVLLGEGPGRFLGQLLRTNPRVAVTCVERSERMIATAQKQLTQSELARVRFEPVDALTWQAPPQEFDLVVTHFFLDCFRRDELESLVTKVATSATADARCKAAGVDDGKRCVAFGRCPIDRDDARSDLEALWKSPPPFMTGLILLTGDCQPEILSGICQE